MRMASSAFSHSERSRGCNEADEVREARLSIPRLTARVAQRDVSTSLDMTCCCTALRLSTVLYCTTSTSSNCPPPTCGPLITSGLRLLSFASVSSKSSFSL